MSNAQRQQFFIQDNLNKQAYTLDLSTVASGFLISIKAAMAPLSIASTKLPASRTTTQSTTICHTNLPVRMHRDQGSSELLPTITFSNNLVNQFAFFLFCSQLYPHDMQFTRNEMKPYEGRYGFGYTISVEVFSIIWVYPWEYNRQPIIIIHVLPGLSMNYRLICLLWNTYRPSNLMLCYRSLRTSY